MKYFSMELFGLHRPHNLLDRGHPLHDQPKPVFLEGNHARIHGLSLDVARVRAPEDLLLDILVDLEELKNTAPAPVPGPIAALAPQSNGKRRLGPSRKKLGKV